MRLECQQATGQPVIRPEICTAAILLPACSIRPSTVFRRPGAGPGWVWMILVSLFGSLTLCSAAHSQDPAGPSPFPTEAGLRCRVYRMDDAPGKWTPVDPSQSPNLDLTVSDLKFPSDPGSNPVGSAAPDQPAVVPEPLRRNLWIQYHGWVRSEVDGEHQFRLTTPAPFRFSLDGEVRCLADQIDPENPDASEARTFQLPLSPGWHELELWVAIRRAEGAALGLEWKEPGKVAMQSLPADRLRALSFYFRPTQPGFKRVAGLGDRPGLGQKLAGPHPGYRVTDIRPAGMEMPVGGLGWLPDGQLVVARFEARTLVAPRPTSEPNGELWLIENPTADPPEAIRGKKIAEGLFEPSGVCVVGSSIYLSQRDHVLRFDLDPASGAWVPTVVAEGWKTNDFHQISAGLLYQAGETAGHPGYLYMARSPGLGLMQNPPDHGSVWRIDLAGKPGQNVTALTGGHRTPNGIGWGPGNQLFVIDNQGEWTPTNELNHVQAGKFYGFYQPHNPPRAHATPFQPADPDSPEAVVTGPAVHLPQDEIGNSPTQPLMFPPGHRYAGQLALADMRYGGINRVDLELVDGVWQGSAMRFTQGLAAGPNRILFGPDGSLYAGGIGGHHASTWYWVNPRNEPTFESLERMTPTGETVFEIEWMRVTPQGFEIRFSEPLAGDFAGEPGNFQLRQWTYRATREYGGPKLEEEPLTVESVRLAADRRSVELIVPGRKTGRVVHLRTDPTSQSGRAIWSGEAWYTLNRIPVAPAPPPNGD